MKAGYTLYAPNEFILWHLWNRGYRKQLRVDLNQEGIISKLNSIGFKGEAEERILRRKMLADKQYRRYFDEKFGIDLLGR